MNKTLEYYEKNAKAFTEETLNVDFSKTQEKFLSLLKNGSKILDFGCGPGRDTKYFLERGFEVDAIDGSKELCKIASEKCGIKVKQMLFSDFCATEKYDAIWACASLLHVPRFELPKILNALWEALKPNGIFYASFKCGKNEEERNGRYFTDFTSKMLDDFFTTSTKFQKIEIWETNDARPEKSSTIWVNGLWRKK